MLLLGVAGHSGAGKSTLALRLAEEVPSAGVVAFGSVVRQLGEQSGIPPEDSRALAELGESCVERDPTGFCQMVLALAPAADLVVVDGVRHARIADALAELAGDGAFRLVSLLEDRRTLVNRLRARGLTRLAALNLLDGPTERDVDDVLHARADLILTPGSSVEDRTRACRELVCEMAR